MWASAPVEASTPILNDGHQSFYSNVSLGTEPAFYTVKIKLSQDPTHRVWVSLSPLKPVPGQEIAIYYDGLVLAEGERPASEPPVFRDQDGQQGTWGSVPFTNLLRNGSGEDAGLRLRPWADELGARFLPDQTRPSLVITYLQDWEGAHLFYRAAADACSVHSGFIRLGACPPGRNRPYILLLASVVAGAGLLVALWRRRWILSWHTVLLFGVTVVLIWGMTFVRGASYLGVPDLYLPVARYAYPAIIPTALLFCLGWLEILGLLRQGLRLPAWVQPVVYLLIFFGLDLLALFSIYQYYYSG
jgi:hypothetical protein